MIAVYYCEESSPYTMMVVEVDSANDFMATMLDKYGELYPRPTSEVLFIEKDRVVETRKR